MITAPNVLFDTIIVAIFHPFEPPEISSKNLDFLEGTPLYRVLYAWVTLETCVILWSPQKHPLNSLGVPSVWSPVCLGNTVEIWYAIFPI